VAKSIGMEDIYLEERFWFDKAEQAIVSDSGRLFSHNSLVAALMVDLSPSGIARIERASM
jgi:hypothetical protein